MRWLGLGIRLATILSGLVAACLTFYGAGRLEGLQENPAPPPVAFMAHRAGVTEWACQRAGPQLLCYDAEDFNRILISNAVEQYCPERLEE